MLLTVASIVQGLHRRLMSLLDNPCTGSPMYSPWRKCLNQSKKPCNTWFSIHYHEKTLQTCGNASICWLKVAIWTSPHQEKHCIISWWLILWPPCGPWATNHMNVLLFAFTWCQPNFHWVVLNVLCIVERTEMLIVIHVVCELGKSLHSPSNVIL